MFLVGLTGGIATGKSTVCSIMREHGCVVIDADQVAREVVQVGRPAYKQILAIFGQSVLYPSGELNRAALGEIVFNDTSKRRALNRCTHPYIQRRMLYLIFKYFLLGKQFVVIDSPLLYETGAFLRLFHKVVVVKCNYQQEVKRLMERNDFTKKQALSRINAQMPLEEKCQHADIVIDNSGDLQSTRTQTETVVGDLKSSKRHWVIRFCVLLPLSVATAGLLWAIGILELS